MPCKDAQRKAMPKSYIRQRQMHSHTCNCTAVVESVTHTARAGSDKNHVNDLEHMCRNIISESTCPQKSCPSCPEVVNKSACPVNPGLSCPKAVRKTTAITDNYPHVRQPSAKTSALGIHASPITSSNVGFRARRL